MAEHAVVIGMSAPNLVCLSAITLFILCAIEFIAHLSVAIDQIAIGVVVNNAALATTVMAARHVAVIIFVHPMNATLPITVIGAAPMIVA